MDPIRTTPVVYGLPPGFGALSCPKYSDGVLSDAVFCSGIGDSDRLATNSPKSMQTGECLVPAIVTQLPLESRSIRGGGKVRQPDTCKAGVDGSNPTGSPECAVVERVETHRRARMHPERRSRPGVHLGSAPGACRSWNDRLRMRLPKYPRFSQSGRRWLS